MQTWQFDKHIADIYGSHVKQHIPNYDRVIEKTLRIIEKKCKDYDTILDFGCADGSTLEKIYNLGYKNLHGTDNSPAMIAKCNTNIATYECSDTIPEKEFKSIIFNWVLHFNKNKKNIIQDAYRKLAKDGFVVVTEKIQTGQFNIDLYYEDKIALGVSPIEIKQKELKLQNSMWLEKLQWYQQTFEEIGFSWEIIDAEWCFVTFLCNKK